MVTAPVLSSVLFSSSSIQVSQLAYAQEGGDDSGGESDSNGGDDSGGESDSNGGDDSGGESDSNGNGGESDSGDQSTSSTTTTDPALAPSSTTTDPALAPSSTTTTDPALAPSSTTTTDPALAPSSTTTDPALGQSPLGLTFSTENTSPSLLEETEEQNLDCGDVSNRNFEVSSDDPNEFDGDNDGIGCESNDEDLNENSGASPVSVTGEGPDNDCLLNPDLPKCASVEGECPDGFFNNDDDQCVPEGGCPDGYHTVDDDETGRCIPESEGCPEGMIFRSDGKTCGSIEIVCEDSPELDGCEDTSCDPSYPDLCISPDQRNLNCDQDGKLEPNEIPDHNFRVNPPDTQGFDKDKDGIGCEKNGKGGNGNNNDNNDNDGNDNNDNDNTSADQYIIKASDSCADISDTVDLTSEQIGPQEVRTIAYFGNCELNSASLQLNLIQNEGLKLVAANLNDGLSDAVEVDMNQIEQSDSNSNILYEATITDNQEGQDLDTEETKTLNNVHGIVLWNDDEDESIEFADNNFVEANINFFN
jgi:hypothetical protein